MGTATWDKRFISDVQIIYSSVIFDKAIDLFELHRELNIPKGKVHSLAKALASDKLFKIRVPKFLRYCKKHGTKPLGFGFGLEELAELIESGKLTGKTEWRFGISPTPSPINKKSRLRYFFEIRFVMDPVAAFAKVGLRGKDAEDAIEFLKECDGGISKGFLFAAGKLAKAYKSVSGSFLPSVFSP